MRRKDKGDQRRDVLGSPILAIFSSRMNCSIVVFSSRFSSCTHGTGVDCIHLDSVGDSQLRQRLGEGQQCGVHRTSDGELRAGARLPEPAMF